MDTTIKLNIGAGTVTIDGFTPIDKKLGHDARKLDYPDNSVDEIRASHILEHFAWRDIEPVLGEMVRVLKPGGRIRIAVPDADKCLSAKEDPKRLAYLMGGQTNENDFHKSAFDEPLLRSLMSNQGLTDIRRWESHNTDCASLPISLNLEGVKSEHAETKRVSLKVAGAMSMPRLGWNDAWGCIQYACMAYRIPVKRFSGAFWGQCLQRCFEEIAEEGADWIFSIDYDSLFSGDDLKKLMGYLVTRPDIDALCPLQARRGTGTALAYTAGATEAKWTGDPLKVDTGHFGCTFIKVEALRKVPKPWFWSKPDANGGWGEGRVDDDIWFWQQWQKAGNTLYMTPDVQIGHLEVFSAGFKEEIIDGNKHLVPAQERVVDWMNRSGMKSTRW